MTFGIRGVGKAELRKLKPRGFARQRRVLVWDVQDGGERNRCNYNGGARGGPLKSAGSTLAFVSCESSSSFVLKAGKLAETMSQYVPYIPLKCLS